MNDEIKKDIKKLVSTYYKGIHKKKFVLGESYIPVASAKFDEAELSALIEASLYMKFVEGAKVKELEKELARFVGTRCAVMCNSGSSANLLAVMALTSPLLGSRALQPGDEIITTAVGFPTTVNPTLQAGCVPVFVDINIPSYNTTPFLVSEAITEKTKAIFLAHTLGNPFDAEAIREIADKNNLWLIEDGCDAIGGVIGEKNVGTYGDISTLSMYPAHHIAVGEGGMVFTNTPLLEKIVRSFRDWGRDCWCSPNKDNTCGKRFLQKDQGSLPDGFDHKYTYSHIGYNLKSTDLQASIGLEQLKKLPEFIADRRANWEYLSSELSDLGKWFYLPNHIENSDPSWFGFVLTVRQDCGFTRNEITAYLESKKIGTRNIFGGNLTKQLAYQGKNWRIADTLGNLANSDRVMNNSFWIGVHPNLTKRMLDYMIMNIREFTIK